MDKKPKIFKPDIGEVNNNKKAYYSFLEDRLNISTEEEPKEDVVDFVNRLSKSGSYIFNKDVVIVTKDKRYETKIAGKIGNRLITLDNESINVDDVIKIYEK